MSILEVSCIRDRRRKPDEPFNPFASNANQVRQRERIKRTGASNSRRIRELIAKIKELEEELLIPRLPKPRINLTHLDPPKKITRAKSRQSVNDMVGFRKKQEEARRRLGAQPTSTARTTQKPAVQTNRPNATADRQTGQRVSRADRLAELRKKSQESVKKNQSILDNHERTARSSKPITVEQREKDTPADSISKQIEGLLSEKANLEDIMSKKKDKKKNPFRKKIRNIEKKIEQLRNG